MGKLAELRQYSNRKILYAVLAVMALALVTSIAAYAALSTLMDTYRLSRGVRDRQLALDTVYVSLREAEASQRGYLLTGMGDYLNGYTVTSSQLPAQIGRLQALSQGFDGEATIGQLLPLITQKRAEIDRTIDLRRAGDTVAAQDIVNTGEGEALMGRIRELVASYDLARQRQLNAYRARTAQLGNLTKVVVLIVAIMTLGLAALIYYFYLKAIASERELDRAKDEFVSLASHQLRTPATGIKSILAMVIAGDFGELNSRQAKYLAKALQSNEREIGIIEELLNVAKADAGRLVLRPGQVDLGELVATIVAEQGPEIERKQQRLDVSYPKTPVVFQADAEKLYMAIGNLLDNARKYTPEGGRIELSLRDRRGSVLVEVADSGIGIDKTDLGRVFDRFHRGRSVLTADIEGTGLGLYLTRRIIELHNGTIKVDSQKGQGSRFTVSLPLRRA